MSSDPLPQLWQLGAPALPADVVDEAAGLAAAEMAAVGLADRLRGSRNRVVRLVVGADLVTGRLVEVYRDAVLVAASDGPVMVTLAALRAVEGAGGPATGPTGRERTTGMTRLRDWQDRHITVAGNDGSLWSGLLRSVGADHLEVGDRLLPWAAVATIRPR